MKTKNPTREPLKVVASIIGGCALIIFGLVLFAEFLFGGSINPVASPEIQATIAYLEQNPQPISSFIEGIYPAPNTNLAPDEYMTINVFFPEDNEAAAIFQWTRFYINGTRIHFIDQSVFSGTLSSFHPKPYQKIMLKPQLPVGTHLFEVYVASSLGEFLFSSDKPYYAWVYDVVDD